LKEQCPNCGEFKLKKGVTTRGCGFILLFGFPLVSLFLVPASSELFGGNVDMDTMSKISLWSIIIGFIIVIISFLSPQKSFTYECESCNYKEERNT